MEKECWVCRRTETEIKNLIPDYEKEDLEKDWMSDETIRSDTHLCPICRELLDGYLISDDSCDFIITVFEERVLPKLRITKTIQQKIVLIDDNEP